MFTNCECDCGGLERIQLFCTSSHCKDPPCYCGEIIEFGSQEKDSVICYGYLSTLIEGSYALIQNNSDRGCSGNAEIFCGARKPYYPSTDSLSIGDRECVGSIATAW